jgi:chromate transporter
MTSLFEIYLTFFKISSVTFGGGMAMLPILQREIVQDKSWIKDEELLDYYALSQGLPGIIAVNVAVFIGYRKRGVWGAVSASLGIVTPCIIVIVLIAAFLSNFQDYTLVKYAFAGIASGVSALIFNSVASLFKKSVIDFKSIIIYLVTLVLLLILPLSPIVFVLAGALVGVIMKKNGERV